MAKHRLLFSKTGRACYISHLDLMRTFQRAFLRADIPIRHTEGFNPHAFISIALPLSVGFSSQCEFLEFELLPGTDMTQVPQRLNRGLPQGVTVAACYEAENPIAKLSWLKYEITLFYDQENNGITQEISTLLQRESWVIEKPSKKAKSGFVTIDISPLVNEFSFTEILGGYTLHITLAAQNPGLNPQVLLNAICDAAPQCRPAFARFHRQDVLDGEMNSFR